jgi:hypothetical protein
MGGFAAIVLSAFGALCQGGRTALGTPITRDSALVHRTACRNLRGVWVIRER